MSNIYTCGTYMCVLQDYSQASYMCVHICVYKYVLHICVYKYVHCIIDIYIENIIEYYASERNCRKACLNVGLPFGVG